VVSFGYWFGDDRFPEPAFYASTAPESAGLADQPLEPAGPGYDDARAEPHPLAAVLDFLRERLPGRRPAGRLEYRAAGLPGGITDPHLRRYQDLSWEQQRR
jgi:hypothetical protein